MHQASHLVLVQGIALTMTAVRSCPALSAHTVVRGDARPSVLAGWGAWAGWGLMEVPDQCNVLWWELSHSLALK